MAMKVTYSWIIYSCLVSGSGILCDRKLEKRQAVSFCSLNTDDTFYCPNGLCIDLSWVCDGRKDCSDGSDESKELCALYEYGTNMTTNCGRVFFNKNELIDNNEKKLVGKARWNVVIFQLQDLKYSPISYGSIIAPNIVITTASMLWHPNMLSTKISVTYGNLKVGVEEYPYYFTKNDSKFTELLNVGTIYIKESYNGEQSSAENIAVIVLANKVSFSNDVVPVCIDWNSKYYVHNGDLGKTTTFRVVNGTTKPGFVEGFFPFFDHSTCREMITTEQQQYLTFDQFCTIYKNEEETYLKPIATDISFLHSNSYFLTGIPALKLKSQNSSIIPVFTDIRFHVQWIRGILNKHFTENSCILPTIEGVIYSYEGSNEILSHGTLINLHRTVIEKCEHGYYKAYPIGFRFCQGKGKWLSNTEKLCFKMCPSLLSDSLDIKCSHNGKYTNCSNLSIPDTIATTSCKPFYTAPITQKDTQLELNCQANGMWNKQLYRCIPNCGRVHIINQVLINNGEKALVGTAPWNVGIYKLNKKKSNYNMICGGSIIAPNLVISAAHCFWQKGMLSKIISITDSLYKTAVGKYDRNFTIIDNEFTQIMNVEMIYLKEDYYGPSGFHAEDIAIILLQDRISFNNGVSPVCIDWNGNYDVVNGDLGKIVGWGKTEKGIPSPILFEAYLPYINHSSCRNMYTNEFEPFVTVDKFCAGYASVSEQGVSKGDSGAGLCFFHSDSYYLTGVVSIKDPNTNTLIAVFTEVKYHIQWIRGLFDKHNQV